MRGEVSPLVRAAASRTHPSQWNQGSATPPDAAAPWETVTPMPTAQTPRRVGGWMTSTVLTSLTAYSLRYATRTACRCVAVAQIIGRSSGPFHRFTRRASTSCHAACGPPPGGCLLDLSSASVGTPGRLRVGQVRWRLLAGARPRSVGAVPGRRRERHSPLLVRRSRPAPCGPLAGFATPLGHEERKGLVSGILKRLIAGEDGVTPVGPDPEFDGDSPGFALLLAVAALPFAGLAGRIELGCLRTARTALLGLGCGALWNWHYRY